MEDLVVGGNIPSKAHALHKFLQTSPATLNRVRLEDDIASKLKGPARTVLGLTKSMLSAHWIYLSGSGLTDGLNSILSPKMISLVTESLEYL